MNLTDHEGVAMLVYTVTRDSQMSGIGIQCSKLVGCQNTSC